MTTTIIAPNGERKTFDDDMKWIEIVDHFEVKEGWFRIENVCVDELVRDGKSVARIWDDGHSGIFEEMHWIPIPNLTKEDAERRLKLLAFS